MKDKSIIFIGIGFGIIGLKSQNQFRFFKYIGSEIGILCKTISVISPQKKRNAPCETFPSFSHLSEW